MNTVCSYCGRTIDRLEEIPHICDNCGVPICQQCYHNTAVVYTDKPTKMSVTGYIRVCKECEKQFDTKIKEHPYLG